MKSSEQLTTFNEAVPTIMFQCITGSRVRRGSNNSGSGYASERGGGYFNQGSSGERDASDSRESGEGCDSDDK